MDLDDTSPVEVFYPRAKDRDKEKDKKDYMAKISEDVITKQELQEIARKTLEETGVKYSGRI